MSILKSTHSGSIRYWEHILTERGYYKHSKYPNAYVHPYDQSEYRLPEDVINFDDNLATVYVVVGNWGRRVQVIDTKHLDMIEEYWRYRRDWTNSSSVNHEKWLGNEIIKYADTH